MVVVKKSEYIANPTLFAFVATYGFSFDGQSFVFGEFIRAVCHPWATHLHVCIAFS